MKTLAILKVIAKMAIFAALVPICRIIDYLGEIVIGLWSMRRR